MTTWQDGHSRKKAQAFVAISCLETLPHSGHVSWLFSLIGDGMVRETE